MENNSIRAKGTYRDIETDDVKLIQEWNSIIAKENAQDESIRYLRSSIFFFLREKKNFIHRVRGQKPAILLTLM